MSKSSQAFVIYRELGIIKNQKDNTFTRDPTNSPGDRVPATPDAVVSKDFRVNYSKSTCMRLYVPTTALNGSSKNLPLVVYFHDGGFINGSFDLEHTHDFCNRLARDSNVVVASASYRQAPEFKLPAAYDDGEDALKWIKYSPDKEWIKSYADLSNVFLMGTNSGGNVAYNVGLRSTEQDITPLCIRGLILHDPFFDGEERCASEVSHENKLDADICWNLCLPDGEDRDHEYSNPTVGDGPDNMEKIRRLGWKVMVTGVRGELLIERQRNVANLFKEKGVDVFERFIFKGESLSHSFTDFIHG
ncbi:unnamed protein product [Eruca vesicaria subsp. sativa]|uniref:Alpha/beta hydrolase fold-3 domain-containing protein n=1 Tax=Eruca vesicaria subsp. sativa TaxID=29727 RepID=A0ABC8LGW7_ERUVS|nr:unnamed protein product [Eruca vesicaria subsp. sativa]